MTSRTTLPAFVLALAIVFALHLPAQSSVATLSGIVLDDQQATIAGATLTLRDAARGLTRQAVTDAGGSFVFPQLPATTWQLTAERAGFAKAKYDAIILNANDQRSLRVTLKLAQRDETVTVTGDAPSLPNLPPSLPSSARSSSRTSPSTAAVSKPSSTSRPASSSPPPASSTRGSSPSTASAPAPTTSQWMEWAQTSASRMPPHPTKVPAALFPPSVFRAAPVRSPP